MSRKSWKHCSLGASVMFGLAPLFVIVAIHGCGYGFQDEISIPIETKCRTDADCILANGTLQPECAWECRQNKCIRMCTSEEPDSTPVDEQPICLRDQLGVMQEGLCSCQCKDCECKTIHCQCDLVCYMNPPPAGCVVNLDENGNMEIDGNALQGCTLECNQENDLADFMPCILRDCSIQGHDIPGSECDQTLHICMELCKKIADKPEALEECQRNCKLENKTCLADTDCRAFIDTCYAICEGQGDFCRRICDQLLEVCLEEESEQPHPETQCKERFQQCLESCALFDSTYDCKRKCKVEYNQCLQTDDPADPEDECRLAFEQCIQQCWQNPDGECKRSCENSLMECLEAIGPNPNEEKCAASYERCMLNCDSVDQTNWCQEKCRSEFESCVETGEPMPYPKECENQFGKCNLGCKDDFACLEACELRLMDCLFATEPCPSSNQCTDNLSYCHSICESFGSVASCFEKCELGSARCFNQAQECQPGDRCRQKYAQCIDSCKPDSSGDCRMLCELEQKICYENQQPCPDESECSFVFQDCQQQCGLDPTDQKCLLMCKFEQESCLEYHYMCRAQAACNQHFAECLDGCNPVSPGGCLKTCEQVQNTCYLQTLPCPDDKRCQLQRDFCEASCTPRDPDQQGNPGAQEVPVECTKRCEEEYGFCQREIEQCELKKQCGIEMNQCLILCGPEKQCAALCVEKNRVCMQALDSCPQASRCDNQQTDCRRRCMESHGGPQCFAMCEYHHEGCLEQIALCEHRHTCLENDALCLDACPLNNNQECMQLCAAKRDACLGEWVLCPSQERCEIFLNECQDNCQGAGLGQECLDWCDSEYASCFDSISECEQQVHCRQQLSQCLDGCDELGVDSNQCLEDCWQQRKACLDAQDTRRTQGGSKWY